MRKQLPYSTPHGYMDSLQGKLEQIPHNQDQPRFSLVPHLALAATFIIMVLAGNFVLNRTKAAAPVSDEVIIEYLIAEGATLAQLENIY